MVHPPPSPSSSTAQFTQQFLSSVLSQRGPSSLPYSEDVKWLIRQHLLSLSESFPSLHPKTATFTHNDGRTVNLLQSDGTVPMLFHNVTYNIPVVIWLMETYPRHPPLVFVNPTRDMVIKRQHSFVNPSGLVSIPYLQNWVYPSSNLVDLARNLSHYFGVDPPLYSQRRPNPNPNPSFNNSSNNTSVSSVSASGLNSSSSIRPAIPPRTYPPSPYGSGRISSPSPTPSPPPGVAGGVTEDPNEVYRRNAINKLVENVHTDVEELRKLGGDVGSVNADEAFEPLDSLSKQMLESTSSDLAIEDAIYAMDKAVQHGSIPFDLYLRNVRLLSREQFFHRATSAKVRAAQMHAQVTSMASRAPPYAV
ncbi:putative ubiquitin E2 variant, ubiquitin-conjugating enzyme/RWD, steadiness box (SB) [Helianthus annuus]|nr:putative ubiquitin E2 variant, ubiquitin-conjugating enzyme/RWD, steadiness box (SB) [Helianthus annuus]